MNNIPKDPIILLSFINTQLRDHYTTLQELCASLSIDENELMEKLASVDYTYDQTQNQFI